MEESKWLCTLSVKCRGSWQYQQFKAFFWQYVEGPITPWYDTTDLNLSVWWQAIFFAVCIFAFLTDETWFQGFCKQQNAWSERHLPTSNTTLVWLLCLLLILKDELSERTSFKNDWHIHWKESLTTGQFSYRGWNKT